MKYLIVGLGNIGGKYLNTRHNIGFKVLDSFAEESSTFFETLRYGDVTTIKYKSRSLILLKPSTFMNLSGNAIAFWLQKEKIPLENLLVITDDLSLPFGKLRLKGKGSDGGHNGLKNIQEVLKSQNYARLRFGIGNAFHKGTQVNYVLGEWSENEKETISEHIDYAKLYIKSFATIGLELSMNFLNKK